MLSRDAYESTTMPSMPGAFERGREIVVFVRSAAFVLAIGACGSSLSNPSAPTTNALTVIVTAPNGVSPSVTVTGPNSYSTSVSATTTLTGLAVGSYTVTAKTVVGSDSIVGTVDTGAVSGSPASVTASGRDTVTAAYTPRPGTGGLWLANRSANTVIEYTAAQLAATTSSAPATAIGTGSHQFGAAFDSHGNLWVTSAAAGTITQFAARDLGASGTPAPTVTITGPAGALPQGIAFDANGNLWVANSSMQTIMEFTASQLASSGTPTPAVTLASASLNTPLALAFDGTGNLWVADYLANTVMEFTASQLASGGMQAPAITLLAFAGSIVNPAALAFDQTGNLWVSNYGSSTLVAFAPSQLVTTGSQPPNVTLSSAGDLKAPVGIAFDASGNLWIANSNANGGLAEFTASQIMSSGSPTPAVLVSETSLGSPGAIAFNPHATNLPIKPMRVR
jgi:hypothetical protein